MASVPLPDQENVRACLLCRRKLPAAEFPPYFPTRCRPCIARNRMERYYQNPAPSRKAARGWYQRNRERRLHTLHAYRAASGTKARQYLAAYYERTRDGIPLRCEGCGAGIPVPLRQHHGAAWLCSSCIGAGVERAARVVDGVRVEVAIHRCRPPFCLECGNGNGAVFLVRKLEERC